MGENSVENKNITKQFYELSDCITLTISDGSSFLITNDRGETLSYTNEKGVFGTINVRNANFYNGVDFEGGKWIELELEVDASDFYMITNESPDIEITVSNDIFFEQVEGINVSSIEFTKDDITIKGNNDFHFIAYADPFIHDSTSLDSVYVEGDAIDDVVITRKDNSIIAQSQENMKNVKTEAYIGLDVYPKEYSEPLKMVEVTLEEPYAKKYDATMFNDNF